MDSLKMYFLLNMVIFHCYVSLPEGKWGCFTPVSWVIIITLLIGNLMTPGTCLSSIFGLQPSPKTRPELQSKQGSFRFYLGIYIYLRLFVLSIIIHDLFLIQDPPNIIQSLLVNHPTKTGLKNMAFDPPEPPLNPSLPTTRLLAWRCGRPAELPEGRHLKFLGRGPKVTGAAARKPLGRWVFLNEKWDFPSQVSYLKMSLLWKMDRNGWIFQLGSVVNNPWLVFVP